MNSTELQFGWTFIVGDTMEFAFGHTLIGIKWR